MDLTLNFGPYVYRNHRKHGKGGSGGGPGQQPQFLGQLPPKRPGQHRVTAIKETLAKSRLGQWKPGELVNLERSLQPAGRLDGHFVQGHVDTLGTLIEKKDLRGSWEFTFGFPEKFAPLVIEKGSIALNGISLTVFNVGGDRFTVAIIPYTFEHTNLAGLATGQQVNLEFDMLGKYLLRSRQLADLPA
jgi:riboflavin synthase